MMPADGHGLAQSNPSGDVGSLLRAAVAISEPAGLGVPGLKLMPGDVLADRFVIERLVRVGGMGSIHRARDRLTLETVAIKVLAPGRVGDAKRFALESAVLAELSHPAIVRYVAHGTSAELASRAGAEWHASSQFLAMEWLEGEDLAERLARAPLTPEESLLVVRRAAEGLFYAHARGVVHRDIKPSNLLLVKRDPRATKVLDFGIARQAEESRTLTQSGMVLGTVGYMSPEQATGRRDVDARADLFALGCVLFECLTGRAAFLGPNALAVLAKVLREDPPRVSELRAGLGGALDALVARLLAKNPGERPESAAALLDQLDALGDLNAIEVAPSAGLTAAEQKIVSVVLGRPRDQHRESDPQLPVDVLALAGRFAGEPLSLCGGGLLIVFSRRGAASDQASHAARCALQLKCLRPELCLAVATGRAETTGRIPVGAAIDRAAQLLEHSVQAGITAPSPVPQEAEAVAQADEPGMAIAIDALSAGLLEPGFAIERLGAVLALVAERADLEHIRPLMGKPSPFVGREKELGLLQLTLRECREESVARAVLLTGPPGQGKSRLRHEFVARVRQRGSARILMARADPAAAGSAFLIARQLVRDALGLRDGVTASDQQAGLRAYVSDVCHGADTARIADFLAELAGLSSTDAASPEWRAARNDPQVMSVWLRRSFAEWLCAECRSEPLLLVLEDLHWGDLASVTCLSEALSMLVEKPFMLLALARPEVQQTFPDLWRGAELQQIALGRLAPRAAERLVRTALGEQLATRDVSNIVQRADGNAFYLEELIRRAAEGDDTGLPETVLALVQSRLQRLAPETRRVVRAASIFGEVFWTGGLATALRDSEGSAELDQQLRQLIAHELTVPCQTSHFSAQRQYMFRHSLLREAAYAMLTEADRAAGHLLAGDWLERAGELDALTLANHFELGKAPKRALPWLLQASQESLDAGTIDATAALGERALACGAAESHLGEVRAQQATLLLARGDLVGALATGKEALALLAPGSRTWVVCAANLFSCAVFLGEPGVTGPLLQAVRAAPHLAQPTGPYAWLIFSVSSGLTALGALDEAAHMLEGAEALQQGPSVDDPAFVAGICIARSYLELLTGELAQALRSISSALALLERIEHPTYQVVARLLLVVIYAQLGHRERAESLCRELLERCQPRELRVFFSRRSVAELAMAKLDSGLTKEAMTSLEPLLELPDRQLALSARASLAHALTLANQLEAAEREARAVLAESVWFPSIRATALSALARVASQRGDWPSVLLLAEQGIEVGTRGLFPRYGAILRLLRCEALRALSRNDEAQSAIRAARDRILHVASGLSDPELRASYLSNVAANARTLELAETWLGEHAS